MVKVPFIGEIAVVNFMEYRMLYLNKVLCVSVSKSILARLQTLFSLLKKVPLPTVWMRWERLLSEKKTLSNINGNWITSKKVESKSWYIALGPWSNCRFPCCFFFGLWNEISMKDYHRLILDVFSVNWVFDFPENVSFCLKFWLFSLSFYFFIL